MALVRTVILFLLLTGASLPAQTPKPRLTVYPRVALDSGVRIEAFIPRHADNRRMGLIVDGPIYRSFEEPLEGEGARAIFSITISRLDEGQYNVFLIIAKADGTRVTIRDTFCRGAGCISEVAP